MLFAKKIEASYITLQDLSQFNANNTRPYFNEGTFYLAPYGNNFIIELKLLLEKGITVLGPNISQLINPISVEQFKLAIHKNLEEYWRPLVEESTKLNRSDYQVFTILTMCRTLYSLETGQITSKNEAAHWTITNCNRCYSAAIEQATQWRPGETLNLAREAKALVKHVLQVSNKK